MKALLEFIKSKPFLINLGSALVLSALLLGFTYKALDHYTMHGETITVPSFKGINKSKLDEFIKDKHLRYVIIDSSVYNAKMAKGVVIEQDPELNTKVKDNRTIYLTINASLPPQVKMPNLIDVSYRQAEAILQTYGLKVGELIYKPDLAKNAVLGQQYKGHEIAPGTFVKKGATISLIMGDGLGNSDVTVPNLINLTYDEAVAELNSYSLNTGSVVYDDNDDKAGARVYKQRPSFSSKKTLSFGETVDLFLTKSSHKIKLDTTDVAP